MGVKNLLGSRDVQKTLYFMEGYTFRIADLRIQDGCIIVKENEKITRAWGHAPKALLPMEKHSAMVQIVNARDGNAADPFHLVDRRERFTDSSIKQRANEMHYKACNTPIGSQLSKLQLFILVIAGFLFLIGGIVFLMKHVGGLYG